MATFESSVRQIPHSQQAVYNMLSDLSNIDRVKDRIPADKLNDLTFDADSMSISTPMGAVKLKIVDREEPKCIKLRRSRVLCHSISGFRYCQLQTLHAK